MCVEIDLTLDTRIGRVDQTLPRLDLDRFSPAIYADVIGLDFSAFVFIDYPNVFLTLIYHMGMVISPYARVIFSCYWLSYRHDVYICVDLWHNTHATSEETTLRGFKRD
jgi:hypothetical protein